MSEIRIEGLDKVQKMLGKLAAKDVLKAPMTASVAHVKGKIAKYPPASAANSPGQRKWYQRGYGSRWRRSDGSVGGRATSQTLGRRWTSKVIKNGMQGEVGNNASYAKYVQDRRRQTWFHKARNWTTVQEVADKEKDNVAKIFNDHIAKIIASNK